VKYRSSTFRGDFPEMAIFQKDPGFKPRARTKNGEFPGFLRFFDLRKKLKNYIEIVILTILGSFSGSILGIQA
jgi:hypothetical protein